MFRIFVISKTIKHHNKRKQVVLTIFHVKNGQGKSFFSTVKMENNENLRFVTKALETIRKVQSPWAWKTLILHGNSKRCIP